MFHFTVVVLFSSFLLFSIFLITNTLFCSHSRYLNELGRHNYVTPTSYLELINSFKTLLQKKQDETMKAKRRYVVGLEKLAFAASQVCTGSVISTAVLYSYFCSDAFLFVGVSCLVLSA